MSAASLAYRDPTRKALVGVTLAARYVQRFPSDTLADRQRRAAILADSLRVMRMGDWQPTFPYFCPPC